MIRLLIDSGADVFVVNHQGINMLHVSAQGDSPASLAIFLEHGLDINSRDYRKSSPLHWASFSNAECILNYIIAWGGDLTSQDVKGLTPLHLAVRQFSDSRSTRGIKQLLLKGADRNILDYDAKKPIDYLPTPKPGDKPDNLSLELRHNILADKWTFLGDCLMIRNTFRK